MAETKPAKRNRLFIIFPAVAVLLVLAGVAVTWWIGQNITQEQMARNVFYAAMPFILTFVAIILLFITFVMAMNAWASGKIAEKTHFRIELAIIIAMVAGILFIFQQWVLSLFQTGFLLLLFATLTFIVWSHIAPKRVRLQEE